MEAHQAQDHLQTFTGLPRTRRFRLGEQRGFFRLSRQWGLVRVYAWPDGKIIEAVCGCIKLNIDECIARCSPGRIDFSAITAYALGGYSMLPCILRADDGCSQGYTQNTFQGQRK